MSELRQREIQHNNLKRVLAEAENHATVPLSLGAVEQYLLIVDELLVKCERFHAAILDTCADEAAIRVQDAVYQGIWKTYSKTVAVLGNLRVQLGKTTALRPASTHFVELPDIQLPTFSGTFKDWTSFEDLFVATVDKNTQLSAAQRLQYLKSCVTGEASNLIKSFPSTDNNYLEAWNLLKSRFDNKREIIQALVKKLIRQQLVKQDSASSLQTLLNTTQECVRSLKVLGRPTDEWDDLLVGIMLEKLDPDIKSEWAKSLSGTDAVTFSDLTKFIERHIRALLARGNLISTSTKPASQTQQQNSSKFTTRSNHVSTSSCSICKLTHPTYQCKTLLSTAPSQRLALVKKTSACLNCLREGHSVRSCSSQFTCKKCQKPHHTLLHIEDESKKVNSNNVATQSNKNTTPQSSDIEMGPPQNTSSPICTGMNSTVHPAAISSSQSAFTPTASSSSTNTTSTNTSSIIGSNQCQTLLKTAVVLVTDASGKQRQCRVLLDDGSEASIISTSLANTLGLKKQRTDIEVEGVSGTHAGNVSWKSTLRLYSRINSLYIDVEVLLLPKVTGITPKMTCDPSKYAYLKDLELADPQFYEPGNIEILLGSDVVPYILRDGRRTGPPDAPIATNSIFGWTLLGRANTIHTQKISVNNMAVSSTIQLTELVQRFWNLEQVPMRKPMSPEERACEKHFEETKSRGTDGRYTVRLPFHPEYIKQPLHHIGDTRSLAEKRLLSLERRFEKYPQHHQEYKKFMQEYINLGHMTLAQTPSSDGIFIPHHFVLKEESTTTKLRVVYDCSMKSAKGISLNDMLMVGPTIQDDLFSLLLRFRLHVVALKADIEKMYRQFRIHPDDQNCLKILWREDKLQPIKEYQLQTVTYGSACAPFQATRCLRQLALDEECKFPDAAAVLKNDTYVDDILSGSTTTGSAIALTRDLIAITDAGKMTVRKWCSNDPIVMQSIPEHLREESCEHTFDDDSGIKALGIAWHPQSDTFRFKVNSKPTVKTKRELLSEIAKTFDPLGWLSPITIRAKLIFQESWTTSQEWDHDLPQRLQQQWKEYQNDLQYISTLHIPRCVVSSDVINYHLVGFADSSQLAYASALYLRCEFGDGSVNVNLLTSKTKVAPVRQTTLPRLELCAALLLAETVDSVITSLKLNCPITCFTDSTVTLQWITSPSRRWKTFVANRVAAIQDIVPSSCWHHVRSQDNPADIPSRGITADVLQQSSLWWHGPAWVTHGSFPNFPEDVDEKEVNQEARSISVNVIATSPPFIATWLKHFSTLRRAINTTATFLKLSSCMKKTNDSYFPFTPEHRQHALHTLIRLVQAAVFTQDIDELKKTGQVSNKSTIKSLSPYIDGMGMLRVGGRLQNANIPEESKQPLLLSKHSHLTILIIQEFHIKHLHGGTDLIHHAIRQHYWITGAKELIRLQIRKCIPCRRARATTMKQMMSPLPSCRVSPSHPFLHTGMDFAGPFPVKVRRGRGATADDYYFCVFVCMATKAIHLEAVSDLTTPGFIAAYHRFVSRRGLPAHLYSDNGKNFVGANKVLQQQLQSLQNQTQLQLSHLGSQWHFIAANSPHQGGVWEGGVKSVKKHFRRVVGSKTMTLEQYQTLLCNIEACLNSRPLCATSSDPNDIAALTPGHFLVGRALTAVPEPCVEHIPVNRLSYWKEVEQLTQHFWRRWTTEYLSTLNQRQKWTRPEVNVRIDDLVLVKDDNLPPTKWKLG